MPKASVYHVQINVSSARRAFPFYRGFLKYLGYRLVDESPGHLGFSNGTTDLWIVQSERPHSKGKYHRKAPGLNHVSFGGFSPAEVRKFARNFLKKRKVNTLFGSPRYFPEYHKDYYAVYFEGPDRLKLELTYGHRKKA